MNKLVKFVWLLLLCITVARAGFSNKTILKSLTYEPPTNLSECNSCENDTCKSFWNALLNSSSIWNNKFESMQVDTPQKHFSSPNKFDNGSSCMFGLHTLSTQITGYSVQIESVLNWTVSIYTVSQNKNKITQSSDIGILGKRFSIPINNMEDVYFVVKSEGRNATMSLNASVQASLGGDTKENPSQGRYYEDDKNYDFNFRGSSHRDTSFNSSWNNDSDDEWNSNSNPKIDLGALWGIIIGSVIAVGLIIFAVAYIIRHYKNKRNEERSSKDPKAKSEPDDPKTGTVVFHEDNHQNVPTQQRAPEDQNEKQISDSYSQNMPYNPGRANVFFEDEEDP